MTETSPSATIVVVSYHDEAQVEDFLAQLAVEVPHYRVIVFRNDCPPSALPLRVPSDLQVTEMRDRRNLGFGSAFNRAGWAVATEVTVGLNSDTKPTADVLEALVRDAATQPDSLFAPVLFNEFGSHGLRPFYRPTTLLASRLRGPSPVRPGAKGWAVGACFAIATDSFRRLGGFDTAYRLYFEDVDLCWRVQENGGRVHVNEKLRLFHAHGRASKRLLSRPFVWHVKGAFIFFAKHPRALFGMEPAAMSEPSWR
ncbi:glycosyltransferase family 2 protein [Modestobacter sp. SYSU DS0290]